MQEAEIGPDPLEQRAFGADVSIGRDAGIVCRFCISLVDCSLNAFDGSGYMRESKSDVVIRRLRHGSAPSGNRGAQRS